jgi:hypothetical protein
MEKRNLESQRKKALEMLNVWLVNLEKQNFINLEDHKKVRLEGNERDK